MTNTRVEHSIVKLFERFEYISFAHENDENGDSLKNIENVKDGPIPGQRWSTFCPCDHFKDSSHSHDKKQLGKQLNPVHNQIRTSELNYLWQKWRGQCKHLLRLLLKTIVIKTCRFANNKVKVNQGSWLLISKGTHASLLSRKTNQLIERRVGE